MAEFKGKRIRWKIILRNSIIVFGLSALGGMVIGITIAFSGVQNIPFAAIAISNIIFGIVGFFICGCITPQERWKYLSYTAITVWVFSLVNLLFAAGKLTLINWFIGLPVTFIFMLIGGGISTLFVKSVE